MISTSTSALSDGRAHDKPANLGWALWAVASAVPWLLPLHSPPWATFYSEVLIAALLVPVAAWALWIVRGHWSVDWLAAAFLLVALLPVLQMLLGFFSFPTEAPLISMYLSGFALTAIVARHAEAAAPSRLSDGLFAGLAIAALLSAGIALYQWLELDALGILIAQPMPGARPFANVMQPNNLSTLLVWGLIAIWWAHWHHHIGDKTATLAAAFLLLGVALTQSRTGWLAVGLLGSSAILARRVLRTSRQAPVWLALALGFVVTVVALEPISHQLFLQPPRLISDQTTAGTRPAIWMVALSAIAQRPWLGYGWNQSVRVYVDKAAELPIHETVGHSHNLVLDLALWNGLPLAMLMVVGLCFWFQHILRKDPTGEQVLLVVALAVFVLHAMLELPHVYAFFLLPVAVMMGTLNALRPIPTLIHIPRIAVTATLILHAGALVLMFDEYGRIEDDLLSARMRAARIAERSPVTAPNIFLLRALQDALLALRIDPVRGISVHELDHLRRTVVRYPSYSSLFRYAKAAAINGRAADASWALRVLCSQNPIGSCQKAAAVWKKEETVGDYPEMALVLFPLHKTELVPAAAAQ